MSPTNRSGRTRWAWLGGCIAAVVVIAAVAAAWLCWGHGARSVAERPLVLIVSGDTAGWIVPCGCASNQSGGLLRRGTYVQRERQGAEVVVADAGGAPAGTSEYDRLKFEAILEGETALGVAAHNIGGPEAALGAAYLRQAAAKTGAPLVSANLLDSSGQAAAPALRIVETKAGRIAVTGVLSHALADDAVRVTDPREAILAALKATQPSYDWLVVLAYLPEDELTELAASLPEADVVVGGPTGQSIAPRRVGPTLLASATNKGKFLARLEAPVAPREDRWRGRIVEMGPELADDAGQRENLERFHQRLAARDFSSDETGLVAALPPGLPADYAIAGTSSCRECHASDCKLWDQTGHAHAWETLRSRGSHVDPYCQQCHTTGYGLPGGFVSRARSSERVSVGCENCHGPSQAHARGPETKTVFAAAEQCSRCHDRENSPTFEYATYWSRIAHGERPAAPANAQTTGDGGG